jgi:hypothetical protein
MSGALSLLMVGSRFVRYSVTIGSFDQGGGQIRYGRNFNATYGAISPSTFNGLTIGTVDCVTLSTFDLAVELRSTGLSQTYFSRIQVQDTAGNVRTYRTADASIFSNGSPNSTIWGWGSGSNLVWTATTPSPRFLDIFH